MLLLSACSTKNYTLTQSKIITIKTKQIKFSDLAYIRSSGDAVELELFMAGESMFRLSIDYLICLKEGCMSKAEFNKRYLSAAYPEPLLQNVLLGKSIYEGENLMQTPDGSVQQILRKDVDILYRVTPKEIYFKDTRNRVLIKIKESK